jgi:hypothetical protein
MVRFVNGFPKAEWVKQNDARNERFDCRVLNLAALEGVGGDAVLEAAAAGLRSRYQQREAEKEGKVIPAPAPDPAPSRASSWVMSGFGGGQPYRPR